MIARIPDAIRWVLFLPLSLGAGYLAGLLVRVLFGRDGSISGAPQTALLPVGDEFIREFGSDGASLEMVGTDLMAGIRDQQAVAMTADERARRAREMAQWLWIRHGRGIDVEHIVVQFISPGETDTILAEHQFSRSELGRRGTSEILRFG